MKIVYVGDNRNRDNFGCRATSTALSQILSKENEIVGRIYGHYTNADANNVFFHKYISEKNYMRFCKMKHWGFVREFLILILRFLGRKTRFNIPSYDFISYDWDKSIQNLKKCIPANPNLTECNLEQYEYDALVVNGEGSFIFSKIPWREALVETMLMYWAMKQGKKVYFMNAMFSAGSGEDLNMETISHIKPILEKINYIGVREKRSYDFAKKYFPEANIHMYPDALFTWTKLLKDGFTVTNGKYFIGYSGAYDSTFSEFDFTKQYICISGSSSRQMGYDLNRTIESYCKLINHLKDSVEHDIYIVIPCSGDSFLKDVARITSTKVIPVDTPILPAAKILGNARVYITGRYHPAILASLGGTPCIFMGSNSHKNISLQETLGYEKISNYNEIPNDMDIEDIIKDCLSCLEKGENLRQKIQNRTEELSIIADKMDQELVRN